MDHTIDRTIVIEQHIIEAWGLWWIQSQKDQAARLRKLVSSESNLYRSNSTPTDLSK